MTVNDINEAAVQSLVELGAVSAESPKMLGESCECDYHDASRQQTCKTSSFRREWCS